MQPVDAVQKNPTNRRVTRILFVDDDPVTLDQLRGAAARYSEVWETAFAPGGEAALALLDAASFDVVVSDLSMPRIDGAALLKSVCDRFPGTVRIVLANSKEMESALRAVTVAHQFLVKPCDPKALLTAIQRASSLFSLLNNQLLATTVGSVRDLPVMPKTYLSLRTALGDPDISMREIVEIVETDVSISAKILQLVNSSLFGLPREVKNLQMAVGYLGINMLQNLVLSAEVFSVFDEAQPIAGFSFEELHEHSQLVASIAGRIPAPPHAQQSAIVAALLHDIGKLVLATRSAKHFERSIRGAVEENLPLYRVERELIGVSHAEVGAYLLGMWGLPAPVVEAVAHHHDPSRIPRQELDAVAIVHLADVLAHQFPVRPPVFPLCRPQVDMRLLLALDLSERLPEWEELAKVAAKELAVGARRKSR